ncbi:SAM-dependent methyltransferase, partial [Rhizobium leguminosarum]
MSKAQDWNLLARDAGTLTAENMSRIVKGLPFNAKLAVRGLLRMQHGSLA